MDIDELNPRIGIGRLGYLERQEARLVATQRQLEEIDGKMEMIHGLCVVALKKDGLSPSDFRQYYTMVLRQIALHIKPSVSLPKPGL